MTGETYGHSVTKWYRNGSPDVPGQPDFRRQMLETGIAVGQRLGHAGFLARLPGKRYLWPQISPCFSVNIEDEELYMAVKLLAQFIRKFPKIVLCLPL